MLVAAQLWERADAPEPGVIALASDTDISALGRRALYSLSGLCQLVALPMSVHVLKVSRTRAVIALVLVAVWVALMAVNPWG